MIREHPRFQKTAMIFISAIQVSDIDRLRGYEMGAVDYVPVPVVPEVLRAKIKVFAELYRKTRQLERLNAELEDRVRARTAELEKSHCAAASRASSAAAWRSPPARWDPGIGTGSTATGCGTRASTGSSASIPQSFEVTPANVQALLHPDDVDELRKAIGRFAKGARSYEMEFRIHRPDGEVRWCVGTAAATIDKGGRVVRVSGVTVDITERKRAEERQNLLTREVDHRAKNALALAQSIVRLTRARRCQGLCPGRRGPHQRARARSHHPVAVELAGRRNRAGWSRKSSRPIRWASQIKRHRLRGAAAAGDRADAGAGAARARDQLGQIWRAFGAVGPGVGRMGPQDDDILILAWEEIGGPLVQKPASRGFGTRSVIASIESQLGGQALFDWRPEGLICRLLVPLSSQAAEASDRKTQLSSNTSFQMSAGSAAR